MKRIKKSLADLEISELLARIYRTVSEKKAEKPVILDVRGISDFADYFVIMSGTSTRHVQGLAEAVDDEIGSRRTREGDTEGLSEARWVLLDYNDIIIHVFHYEDRDHYDLEGLWHDAPRLDPKKLLNPGKTV
ncbi:MAG: ribosome silencing factor [Proteobacteria bacterium]|nr:ribosome silencing factor [Pseudomonadota bacterium]MBU1738476.1 ribosome silencing factor [Pseudomonadota bacterium]